MEVVLDTEENHVLVALLPYPRDLRIALEEGWYRIPVSENSPELIRNGKATHIAFYQPASFGADRYTVQWYSPVSSLRIKTRLELLPNEPEHPDAHKSYYVVGCKQLQQLPAAIRSRRPRRIIFFPTTLRRLFTATDINFLFNDSPLEDLLWRELIKANIPAERQYDVRSRDRWYKLDFAVFCKTAGLDIECDSDTYHMDPDRVEYDKRRTNLLVAAGWHVLPFTTTMLRKNMNATMQTVHDAINRYGGLVDPDSEGGYRYTQDPDDPQPRLFP